MILANLIYCSQCDKQIESDENIMLFAKLPQNYSKLTGLNIGEIEGGKLFCERCFTSLIGSDVVKNLGGVQKINAKAKTK